jgi:hypothetical protein
VFDQRHYVPILLTKRGERRGVSDLTPPVKSGLTPLFVVPPYDWNYDTGAPAKTVDQHLSKTGKEISEYWGSDRAFIDPYFLDDAERMTNGQHPLDFIVEQGNAHGAALVPCVSQARDTAYLATVASIHARDGRGACLRLALPEWPSSTGKRALDQLLSDIGLQPDAVDLVLDVGDEVSGAPNVTVTAVRTELATLPYVHDWRSLTVAAAGFPPPPLAFGKGLSVIDRQDWAAYTAVVNGPALPRVPTFADYGIAHPDPTVDIDPKLMSISASFRYTVDAAWIFAKGELFKGRAGLGQGGTALVPVAARLCAHPLFAGAGHCIADGWLTDVASGQTSGGNPELWRRAGTTHHLTHLISEIATLHGPSGVGAPSPAAP